MVVIKNLSGFTPTAGLGLGLFPMETYGEKLVMLSTVGASHGNVTSVGSSYELHVTCMATACVVVNALFCQMTTMQPCAAVDVAQTSH